MLAKRALTRSRRLPAKAATAPDVAAAGPSSFSRSSGASTGLAAGGDGHHQRRAVDERRHDEAGAFRVIHHVGKDPRLIGAPGRPGYSPRADRWRPPPATCPSVAWREFTGQPLDGPVGSQFRQLGVEIGRDHGELGTGISSRRALRSATRRRRPSTGLLSSRQRWASSPWGLRIRRFGSGWRWWWSRSPRPGAGLGGWHTSSRGPKRAPETVLPTRSPTAGCGPMPPRV